MVEYYLNIRVILTWYLNLIYLIIYISKDKGEYMQAVLDDLKKNQILSSYQIHQLKSTIKEKYPMSSNQERAIIFAKHVHEVIDHILFPFSTEDQKTIKNALLQEAVQREIFAIDAYDVCKTCMDLKLTEGDVLTHFTTWINQHQSRQLTPKDVTSLSQLFYAPPSIPLTIDPVAPKWKLTFPSINWRYSLLLAIFVTVISIVGYGYTQVKSAFAPITLLDTSALETTQLPISITLVEKSNQLQKHLQYKEVNKNALQHWLEERNSLLCEEPYFDQIMATAKDFNINPLLLFAITGQEQGFVPKHHTNALEIASNPFNVYGSWKAYNTSIEDSSRIAARTIINLSKGCPDDADPIMWLNQNYAEDPNWYKGVTALLNQLEKIALLEDTH